ncbi:MAG: protein O-mannosyl-transferase family, partial [Gammaproteobacteria bacterium]
MPNTVPDRITDSVIHVGIVFALVLANYLLSTPATVMLDDDGYFILAAYFNGVAHEPGYPLYTVLAHIATWLPFGTVAWRVHALSGLFGALACACLWLLAYRLIQDKLYAHIAAFAFAFSRTFWSQSIIAEVYSLNVLLFFLLLLLCVAHTQSSGTGGDRGRPERLAFLYGLSLTNHWPLMILSTPALIATLWTRLG